MVLWKYNSNFMCQTHTHKRFSFISFGTTCKSTKVYIDQIVLICFRFDWPGIVFVALSFLFGFIAIVFHFSSFIFVQKKKPTITWNEIGSNRPHRVRNWSATKWPTGGVLNTYFIFSTVCLWYFFYMSNQIQINNMRPEWLVLHLVSVVRFW